MKELNNNRTTDFFLLPCAQPMEPSVKRHYIAALVVLVCAVVYLNVAHSSPAPLSCRAELSQ
ncbi:MULTISPECIES: hypothetical protein [Massilia]|uniref:Uncharacterized protein n=3 Tax=Massilia TaxID=149698 RepID=A0ABX0MWY2_9BURK|nr:MULTISPECIES: hypothetical protein [Massilia]MDQ1835482.1 hypothetical protein [Massilia sp. CCM 9029]NHZ67208.1 hypothetical protein [Massilia genomosp. 1]NHZ94038.1 hypothetical protein [Massilia mucilaginosa]NIA01013.1 hypothetical protein [Massilia sp. CCM 8734]